MVDAKGEWRWELLQHRLPTSILLRLAAIKLPMSFFPADSIGWRLRSDGRFSVKTAYQVRMDLAWDLGCRHLIIESDSAEALQMVQQHASGSGPYIIVSYIRQICNKDWSIVFSKVARSNNSVADWLAKFASDTNFDVIFFESPPDGLVFG
ncbi:hypothetical protein V6N13_113321 [Hibiscus sabdariffa]